ncbi:DUF4870 domain-containing protein [Falsibacillus albus]|uniref:DUF4870 domain-containing protein n=1 Tax=Falsibacillus albus TaxID=2478915 RepID=UPI001F4237B4|nr:DUF4870 domain-containing protein [Falsibacillus albus]
MNDNSNKAISSLCYFSVFFAGFILPLIVWLVVKDSEVKRHAKSALISHIIPVITIPFIIGAVFMDIGTFSSGTGIPGFFIIAIVLSILLSLIVVIWNVYKGIKVLL